MTEKELKGVKKGDIIMVPFEVIRVDGEREYPVLLLQGVDVGASPDWPRREALLEHCQLVPRV